MGMRQLRQLRFLRSLHTKDPVHKRVLVVRLLSQLCDLMTGCMGSMWAGCQGSFVYSSLYLRQIMKMPLGQFSLDDITHHPA